MSQTNARRYESRTAATAELHMQAQKANLLHSPRMWLSLGLMLAVCVMCGASIVVSISGNGAIPLDTCVIFLVALGVTVYRVLMVRKTIQRAGARFREANPDGVSNVMCWVQDGTLHAQSLHGKHEIALGSFRRLVAHQGVVVLLTKERQFIPFFREALTDDKWHALCAEIKAANPKFKSNLK